MPTTSKLSKLFTAIARKDFEQAKGLAMEMAQDEEKKGHQKAAKLLRGSLHPNGKKIDRGTEVLKDSAQASIITDALAAVTADVRLVEVMLRSRWRKELEEIKIEWENRAMLMGQGIRHRSRLLFHGPPGCGKSFAARALGHELRLPTYVVRFDSIIGAYLGQTAIHLRQLFEFAERNPCVLLFDEIDALGRRRGSPLDVGELDRIVIALMQELEFCQAQGLIIATTNLAKNLDDALWRRFDSAISFAKPSQKELQAHARRICEKYKIGMGCVNKDIVRCSNYADVNTVVENAVRREALSSVRNGNG